MLILTNVLGAVFALVMLGLLVLLLRQVNKEWEEPDSLTYDEWLDRHG